MYKIVYKGKDEYGVFYSALDLFCYSEEEALERFSSFTKESGTWDVEIDSIEELATQSEDPKQQPVEYGHVYFPDVE